MCSIEDCGREVIARGYCARHYKQWSRTGSPNITRAKSVCSVEDCDGFVFGQGWCRKHYARVRQYGTLELTRNGSTTYQAVHKRIRKSLGSASLLPCVDCGRAARQWSYNHNDPDEISGLNRGIMVTYSVNEQYYEPRCVRCHRIFDVSWEGQ